jgi:hypothetical protein
VGKNNEALLEEIYGTKAWNTIAARYDTEQRVMSSIKPEVMKELNEVWQKMCDKGEGDMLNRFFYHFFKSFRLLFKLFNTKSKFRI